MQCQVENGRPNFGSMGTVAVPDALVVKMECEAGHITHSVLQEQRFELLSEMAVTAIADGYFREAVGSFQASLERLYEFFLRVCWRRARLSQTETDRVWKLMAAQSERQFGAFSAEFFRETGRVPPTLRDVSVKFRNDVIHKGAFPTREEAISFGEAVATVVGPILKHLKSDECAPVVQQLVLEQIRRGYEEASAAGAHPSTMGLVTPFSLMVDAEIDLRKSVDEHEKRPDLTEAIRLAHALGVSAKHRAETA